MLQTLILSLSFGSKDSVPTSVSHGVTVELPPFALWKNLIKGPQRLLYCRRYRSFLLKIIQ